MTSSLTITTGARLHFGPLSYGSDSPPFFGGVGLMVDAPGFRIELSASNRDCIEGSERYANRAADLLRKCRERIVGPEKAAPFQLTIHEQIPPHAGLGSGTQLALAIARGYAEWHHAASFATIDLAKRVERGRRSAIGIHGFEQGGFLIDAGKGSDDDIGTLAARVPVCSDWRFVLVTPRDQPGLAGSAETTAFAQLPPMPAATTERLSHIAEHQLLPAVRDADFETFSESLFEFGTAAGEYFAPVQGGTFRHPAMSRLVEAMRGDGFSGIAQSSWGPTICIAADSQSVAQQLADSLQSSPLCRESDIVITRPRNSGAVCRRISEDQAIPR